MRKFCRPLFSLPVLAATALLLLGANNQVKSSVTSKQTSSASTGVASRLSTSVTASVASRLTSSATTSVISKSTGTQVTLSSYAEELAKNIKFDRQVLLMVKEETQEHIYQLIGYDQDNYQIMAAGIAVLVPEDMTDRILASLRRKLVPRKYMPFIVEMNAGLKYDRIGVLKGTDQYEILRVMHTDGDDYDIANQDVIDRLKEWEETAPFDIIGAEGDWVEIEFKTLPKDLKSFVEEVYEFCPDAIDQGPGSVEDLVKDLKMTKRLFLWWD